MLFKLILLLIIAYFLGAIPFAYLITKMVKGEDIRNIGSGNVGATNVFRGVGKGYGILTLLMDAFKGYLAVKLAIYFLPEHIMGQLYVAIMVIIGHGFSVFLKGKGGKSVATTLGVFIALAFPVVFFTFIVFISVVALFGYISVGSIVGSIFLPLALWTMKYDQPIIIFAAILCGYIIYKHKPNISRLIQGEEDKFIKGV
ncbi:MAG: glycerol-3-phosphate 1-O-acyltransferase PlsY [bacterium]|nr:glycerol-3-phosphate 1-O-acyltransferase PlsY [bacterium]